MNRKKILIITYIVPYPADAGGKISIFGTINYLRLYLDITLVVSTYNKADEDNVALLGSLWPEVSIKTVDYYKKKSLPHKILSPIYKLTSVTIAKLKNLILQRPLDNGQDKMNFFPFYPVDIIFITFLEKLFSKNNYDIIQVEYTTLLSLIHILPANSVKVFVQIENRYSIIQDFFLKNKNNSLYSDYIVENARYTELSLMNKYDYIVALNKNDKDNLGKYINKEKIEVAPFPILDSLSAVDDQLKFSKNQVNKLIFLGPQAHFPNQDAVSWFAEEMYEQIYARYKLKLYVTGKWSKNFIKKHPNIIFTGYVDNLADIIKNSIVISPIRLGGGGIRAKVLQAMAMRVPLISTSLGSEGIEDLQNHVNIYLADDKMQFINAIENIIENEIKTNSIIDNAYELIQKYYTEKSVGEIRKHMYNKFLLTELNKNKFKN